MCLSPCQHILAPQWWEMVGSVNGQVSPSLRPNLPSVLAPLGEPSLSRLGAEERTSRGKGLAPLFHSPRRGNSNPHEIQSHETVKHALHVGPNPAQVSFAKDTKDTRTLRSNPTHPGTYTPLQPLNR